MSTIHEPDTGYNVRAGAMILADRFSELATCGTCHEPVSPTSGQCLAVGTCRSADRAAVRASLVRGTAASARPAAWTSSGRVD